MIMQSMGSLGMAMLQWAPDLGVTRPTIRPVQEGWGLHPFDWTDSLRNDGASRGEGGACLALEEIVARSTIS